jgi:serine/threonine protein kinase
MLTQSQPQNAAVAPCGIQCTEISIQRNKENELGSGSYATVYRAKNGQTGELVACKLTSFQISNKTSSALKDARLRQLTFETEQRVLHRLREKGSGSCHLARLHSAAFYPPENLGILVMELLPRRTLEMELDQRRDDDDSGFLTPTQVVSMAGQLAHAVDALHRSGIAHRDIKPENISFACSEDGTCHIKLFDFGLALLSHEGTTPARLLTSSTNCSPLYAAPEIVRGESNHDAFAADVWAIGQTIYYMITLRHLFDSLRRFDELKEALMKRTFDPLKNEHVRGHSLYHWLIEQTLVYEPARNRIKVARLLQELEHRH